MSYLQAKPTANSYQPTANKNMQPAILSKKTTLLLLLLIPVVSFFMHYSIFEKELSGVHVWRQSVTEINIQNFYRHDFNILNPRTNNLEGGNFGHGIDRLEFPLMQWLIACVHKLSVDKIIVSRICLFFIGLLSVWGMFNLLNNILKDNLASLLGAWAFNFAPVFYYYTMNPIPDNFALCTAIWSLSYFFKFLDYRKRNDVLFSAFFLMLAALTKLPYIIFGIAPAVFILKRSFQNLKDRKELFKFFGIGLIYIIFQLPTLAWYSWVVPHWGGGVTTGVFGSGITHERYIELLQFHYNEWLPRLVLNVGSVIFFVGSFFVAFGQGIFKKEKFLLLLSVFLIVILYFLLELNIIDKVHDYYLMPFFIPFFVMVGSGIKLFYNFSFLLRSIAIIFLLSLPKLAYDEVQKYWTLFSDNDLFNNRNILRSAVPKDALCCILNDDSGCVFSYQIDKQGFIFNIDSLPPPYLQDMIENKNVTYMYSTSRKADENPEIMKFFESVVIKCGTVHVFKLKRL